MWFCLCYLLRNHDAPMLQHYELINSYYVNTKIPNDNAQFPNKSQYIKFQSLLNDDDRLSGLK